MERHRQPRRECKSPLLSMNNTMRRSYYVFGLSWVINTAPNPFSRPAVCIKRIFSPLLIKGLAFISSDLQLFTYLQKSHHLLLLISDFFVQSLALFFFTQRRNQSLCRMCQREISNLLKVTDGQFGQYNIIKKLQLRSSSHFTRSKM